MRGKANFLLGAAVGYVLGARAGRERYEQIMSKGQQLWTSPRVREAVSDAGEAVKTQAPVVQQKLGDAAKHATDTAKSKLHSDSDDEDADMRATPFDPTQRTNSTSVS